MLIPNMAHAGWSSQIYAGLGGGWMQNDLSTTMQNIYVIHPNYSSSHSFDTNNGQATGNAFIGLGAQNAACYLALEGDAFYTNQEDTSTYPAPLDYTNHSVSSQMKWRYELDTIVGYYFTPRWLGYGKVGITAGNIESNYQAIDTQQQTLASSASASHTLYGGVAGLGAQYALTSNWHLGAEADYIRFANASETVPNAMYLNWSQPYTFQYQLSQYLVKATVSYWF